MGKRIVEQTIKKLKAPEQGNWIEWDSEIPGFGVRITAGGVTSFVLDYRIFGRQRRYTIGRYPELTATAARIRAGQLRVKIQDGHDPLEERIESRSEPTLGDLADEYMKSDGERKKRPTSIRNDKQMIESNIRPTLGRMRLKAVGKHDIEKLHSSLKETPYQANRVLALLSTMFNYAIEEGMITQNPAKGIVKWDEAKREYILSVDALQRFREAVDGYKDQNAANALRLLLLTGSRKGEVLSARWEEFDLERGVWTKPSHHTKQKKTEHVPLSKPTLKLLESMMPANPTGPLFPGRDGGTRVSLKRPWVQACKAAGLVKEELVQGKRRVITKYQPTIRTHDLRHNFASHLVNNGVTLQVVGKLLGHTQVATTARYAHLQNETLRDASNVFGTIYNNARKTGT